MSRWKTVLHNKEIVQGNTHVPILLNNEIMLCVLKDYLTTPRKLTPGTEFKLGPPAAADSIYLMLQCNRPCTIPNL
ncbi:hypothetical protein ACET3Z_018567 [Daucus carota]